MHYSKNLYMATSENQPHKALKHHIQIRVFHFKSQVFIFSGFSSNI